MFRSEPIFAEAIKKELHLLLGNTFSNSNTTIANFFSQSRMSSSSGSCSFRTSLLLAPAVQVVRLSPNDRLYGQCGGAAAFAWEQTTSCGHLCHGSPRIAETGVRFERRKLQWLFRMPSLVKSWTLGPWG